MRHLNLFPDAGRKVEESRGALKALYRVLPHHALVALKREVHLAWLRARAARTVRSFRGASDLLVNVGAGPTGREGWVNVDGWRAAGVNCLFDARKRLPFPDGSVRGLFTEHFVEHLDYTEELPSFLSECRRVLAVGGVLRVIVPDAGKYLKAYTQGGWDELSRMRPLREEREDTHFGCRYNTRMELINMVFHQGGEHRFGYDYETLAFLLERYGLHSVTERAFRESTLPELAIDQEHRAPESLRVEALR